jgi:starch synthase
VGTLKLLMVTSEVAPFARTGGLGDVLGALPQALAEAGHEVLVVAPLFPSVLTAAGLRNTGKSVEVGFPSGTETAGLVEAVVDKGARFVFLDHPGFFARAGFYGDANGDYADNARRFAFLSEGALSAAGVLGFQEQIIHAHDWHAGLAPLLARRQGRASKSVFTIHNLAYQGKFTDAVIDELGLPASDFHPEGYEFFKDVSFLKAGLVYADAITTVSPRYANEILTPEFGFGLEGVLQRRKDRLSGILNGIDRREWDPANDPALPAHFTDRDLDGKAQCRGELLKTFGVPASEDRIPVFGMVSRLVEQKGIDLVTEALPRMLDAGAQVVVLGNGQPEYEDALRRARQRFPKRFGVKIGFDDRLSKLVLAGSDLYLMPSRFEPCGLAQMYALRYGSVPVVRAVGGLDDTVIDVDADKKRGTGFKFEAYRTEALLAAVTRALNTFRDGKAFREVVRRGMKADFSWSKSARAYEALYQQLLAPG